MISRNREEGLNKPVTLNKWYAFEPEALPCVIFPPWRFPGTHPQVNHGWNSLPGLTWWSTPFHDTQHPSSCRAIRSKEMETPPDSCCMDAGPEGITTCL
jgi:hypothetical protein